MTLDELDYTTRRHIATAEENEQFAREMLQQSRPSPPSLRWATVSLFYAGVHYVNAYLWEHARLVPRDHLDREALINRWPELARMSLAYQALKNRSLQARYEPGARIPRGDVQFLLVTDLRTIKDAIRTSLDI
jgi:hypothetical protein